MMKPTRPLLIAPLTALALAFALPATAQTATEDAAAAAAKVTTDAEFIRLATSSNILEIKSSQMAADRSKSDAVKAFAKQMINDHTAASEKLASVTNDKAPDLSADLSAQLDPKHAQMMSTLEQAGDDGFDAAYAQLQVQAHQEAVALFQSYSTQGQAGAVKDFAAQTLPKLQEHLQMAQKLTAE